MAAAALAMGLHPSPLHPKTQNPIPFYTVSAEPELIVLLEWGFSLRFAGGSKLRIRSWVRIGSEAAKMVCLGGRKLCVSCVGMGRPRTPNPRAL